MANILGSPSPPSRRRWALLAILPACGPLGLVVYVVAGVSLPLAVCIPLVVGVAFWITISRHRPAIIPTLRGNLKVGAAAGLAATLVYDLTRYGTVALFSLSFDPFHVFEIFGRLFVGEEASMAHALAVGFAYHVFNGVGLGISYRLLVRRPTIISGVAWAVGLEIAMALLYPAWLRIAALGEFLTVSGLGHLVYGAALAVACRKLDDRWPAAVEVGRTSPRAV